MSQVDTHCLEQGILEAFALSGLSSEDHDVVEQQLKDCSVEPDPSMSVWIRLAQRIGTEGWTALEKQFALAPGWPDLAWLQPAPGIYCKILSTDVGRRRVSMLLRLDPQVDFPPHVHAGVEELHLLDGELWIDDRKLQPGDCHHAEPGSSRQRVWSKAGCTCVLMTSPDDAMEHRLTTP